MENKMKWADPEGAFWLWMMLLTCCAVGFYIIIKWGLKYVL